MADSMKANTDVNALELQNRTDRAAKEPATLNHKGTKLELQSVEDVELGYNILYNKKCRSKYPTFDIDLEDFNRDYYSRPMAWHYMNTSYRHYHKICDLWEILATQVKKAEAQAAAVKEHSTKQLSVRWAIEIKGLEGKASKWNVELEYLADEVLDKFCQDFSGSD
ncbi:MAG: hypothetical protein LQ338_008204 [Usnochroma carphineum]|nr:MAG: hypothetical protein LQ338_008204 [Usnochroma carphineum]